MKRRVLLNAFLLLVLVVDVCRPELGARSLYADQVLYARAGLGRKRSIGSGLNYFREHRTAPGGSSGSAVPPVPGDPGMGSFSAMNPFIPGSSTAGANSASPPPLADPGMSSFGGIWAGYIPSGIGNFIPGYSPPVPSPAVPPTTAASPVHFIPTPTSPPPKLAPTTPTSTSKTPKVPSQQDVEFRNSSGQPQVLPGLLGELQKVVRALELQQRSQITNRTQTTHSQSSSSNHQTTTSASPITAGSEMEAPPVSVQAPPTLIQAPPTTLQAPPPPAQAPPTSAGGFSSTYSAGADYSSYIPAAYATYSSYPGAATATTGSKRTVTLPDEYLNLYGIFGYPILIPVDDDADTDGDVNDTRRALLLLREKRNADRNQDHTRKEDQRLNGEKNQNQNRNQDQQKGRDDQENEKEDANSESTEGHGETNVPGYSGSGWRKGSHGGGAVSGDHYNYQWNY